MSRNFLFIQKDVRGLLISHVPQYGIQIVMLLSVLEKPETVVFVCHSSSISKQEDNYKLQRVPCYMLDVSKRKGPQQSENVFPKKKFPLPSKHEP